MQRSYLDYSMSMITARALPDARDGLKPVHRRVLFSMSEQGMTYGRPTKKSARVVGDVIGKYHPHGDAAVYDALVRMAQGFSLRYPMVDGQGNFGSIDGDPPAAMRYTEARMTRGAEEMLADIDKDTVTFASNYDDTMQEPTVLPAKMPFLLLNGATGIAVGMATNMAPHNLNEVVDAIVATIDDPDIEIPDLMKIIPGPDFPTGGVIYGRSGIRDAYMTGRGKVIVRARATIEEQDNGRERIIVTEIPYMVNKTTLLERIADLVRNKTVEGISFIRDESDRNGLRIVVGVKKDAYGEVVLNRLFRYSNLQTSFGIINLALVDMRPRQLNLKEMITCYIDHRHSVVTRRTEHDLKRARERAHILEGLRIALQNIDEIVELIKTSPSPEEAHGRLMNRFGLSQVQAKAILDMRLQRLTGLERDKIEAEYAELQIQIADLEDILASRERRMNIIKDELLELRARFGDARRTDIMESSADVDIEDMIADEPMVITMTGSGYIKRCPLSIYRSQGRGGRGVRGMASKDQDFVKHMFVASAHSQILFFTNMGRCYWLKVYRIPESGRQSGGRAIVNLLSMRQGEHVAAFVTVKEFDDTHFIVIATERGVINKQPLKAYSNVRRDGINAINLDEGDRLIECKLTDGDSEILFGTRNGQAVRFHESATRELGRNTRGMKGIKLRGDDRVVSMVVVKEADEVLTVTSRGFGKRTPVFDYRRTNRGGSGIINIKLTDRNGKVTGLKGISDDGDLMLITRRGIIIRSDLAKISTIGRNTRGIKLIALDQDDEVIDLALCEKEEEESLGCDNETESPNTGESPAVEENEERTGESDEGEQNSEE
jgi:DNA gyrase subunit A